MPDEYVPELAQANDTEPETVTPVETPAVVDIAPSVVEVAPEAVPAVEPEPVIEVVPEPSPVIEPVIEPVKVATPKVEVAYIENAWNGFPHFECQSCKFDTLDRGAMLAHLNQGHPLVTPFVPPPVSIQYDRFGYPVVEGQPTPYVPPATEKVARYDRFGNLVVEEGV